MDNQEENKHVHTPQWRKETPSNGYTRLSEFDEQHPHKLIDAVTTKSKKKNDREKFLMQGAIPKECSSRQIDGLHCPENQLGLNPCKWYKTNKKQGATPKKCSSGQIDSLCYSENQLLLGPHKWYKTTKKGQETRSNSGSSGEPKNKKSQPFSSFPFYYVVPEDPSPINILPSGKYLVIPQSKLCNIPLAIIVHPKQLDKSRHEAGDSETGMPPKKGFKISEESIDLSENPNGKTSPVGKRTGSASDSHDSESQPKSHCDNQGPEPCAELEKEGSGESPENAVQLTEELYNDDYIRESPQHLCNSGDSLTDSHLAFLMDKLPYYDENFLQRNWSQRTGEDTVEVFMNEMKERRENEVYITVLNYLPQINVDYLKKKIPEIITSDEDVIIFVEAEKQKARENIVERLKNELGFDMAEIVDVMDGFADSYKSDEEDLIVQQFRNKLLANRAMERKMQQLQMISAILPDVEPSFVLSKLDELNDGDEDLNEFMNSLLENPVYPKSMEWDPETREKQKLWKYYVTNFSVTNYLRKVPDPEQRFSGSRVKDDRIDADIAVAFLEKRYPDLDTFQLNQIFIDSDESIVKACLILDRNYLPELFLDEELKNKKLNEAFLQEVTFVVHKDKILRHLKEERERREIERRLAEEENSFFECVVCFDSSVISYDAVTCPDGHIACRNCVVTYIETSFAEGKITFPCLSGFCDTEYAMETVEKFLQPQLFSKITQRRAADDVDKAAVSGLEKCPSCHYAYVPAPDDKIFTCLNEECLRVSCRLCKEINHIPLTCNEVERPKDLQARRRVEEAMTEKLVRSCPNCQKKFIKTDGCNKITCPCGTVSCYICLAVVDNYDHFNGLGGTELQKCPLFSDNLKLHVVDVVAAGVEMKEKLLKETPDIHFVHDPTEDNEL